MARDYKMIDATDVEKGQELYFPKGVGGNVPSHWVVWNVRKVTKNTFRMYHGRPSAYIQNWVDYPKLRADGTPNKLIVLL